MKKNTVVECFVSMRDGVKLYTAIQKPEPEGRFPVIIIRTPYSTLETDLDMLASEDTHGYVILTQQCRGTARSEGICNAYLNERNDGLDFLDWIRQQPFYNGELFLLGSSYLSSVHFSYLDTNPPDVKAAFLAVQDTSRYNICYRNGFFKTGLHGRWIITMHKKNQSIVRNYTESSFQVLPLAGVTKTIFEEYVPYIEESFCHPDPQDPYWDTPEGGRDYRDACLKCTVPILLATSMYDLYTGGIFDMWKKLPPERKKDCALVVTPFDHSYNPLPERVPPEMQEFDDALLRNIVPGLEYIWFDHFRSGTPLKFVERGSTIYYRLWDNSWHCVPEFSNAPGERHYFLTPDRTLAGHAESGDITYTYDPQKPAAFPGGVCNNFGGMQEQDKANSRPDIISFVSEPLEKEMICEGSIELELHCRSTAEDSCFYVRLSFERDGRILPLRDDIDSLCRQDADYVPGTVRVIKYIFAPHAFKLHRGDRLRLDISSSCVPHFQIHSNRKGIQAFQKESCSCSNTILTGSSVLKIFTK